jgi:polysaccharide biosynthesis/export protein
MYSKFALPLLLPVILSAAPPTPSAPANTNQNPATTPLATNNPVGISVDPDYRLAIGDQLLIAIFGENDLNINPIIDRSGKVRLPLVGELSLSGLAVREAEKLIETTYIKEEYLRAPQVSLRLSAYAVREYTILGAVRTPGTIQFPTDSTSIDIRDVISRQGGFLPTAKGNAVKISRRKPDGSETDEIIDVEKMMFGRNRDQITAYLIYPGDRIFVPDRLF